MSSELNLPARPHVPGGEPAAAGSGTAFGAGGRTYRVFLSYSHADSAWARWLMRRLESFPVPARFQGRKAPIGPVGARIAPVFRDRDELPTTSDLGETIRAALRQSATLVVICSPASAKSRWVQEEILAFKRMGGAARVFAFIVAGEPKADGTDEDCFSPALRRELAPDGTLSPHPSEHVAADARPQGDGKEDAFVRLVAGLLGVGFDELRQREQQRRVRRLTVIATCSALGMTITLGLAAVAWQARNDARRRQEQAEDLLGFMLGDLRTQLEKVGRLDVLEAVGDKSMAYFAGLNPRDLTDLALARQAKALTQIGEIRMAQTRYPEAARAFSTAYESAAALAARHPQNGEMLFERGQAEYWIGYVHWRRGDLMPAREWLRRYRETSVVLAALDASRPEWQSELAYGQHNMAVLDMERDKLDDAGGEFRAELTTLKKMAASAPTDYPLQARIADAVSYLGTIAERGGNFAVALEQYQEYTRIFEALMKSDPRTARWQDRRSNALAMEATVLEITGQRAAALARREQARALSEVLVAKDSTNRIWLLSASKHDLKEAMLKRAEGDAASARQLADEARVGLEKLNKAESTDRTIAGLLVTAWRLEAQMRGEAGRDDAAAAAARAVAIGEDLMTKERANDELAGEYLRACVVNGWIAHQRGEQALALRCWERAADVASRIKDTSNWRILDPAARVFACLDRVEESRAVIARLNRLGYQPLEPWPDVARP